MIARFLATKPLWWGYSAREDGMILAPNGDILPQHMYGNYYGVWLKNPENGRGTQRHVHRLMARAFVNNPRPDVFKIVDHIDRNERNNECFEQKPNLRWLNNSLNLLNRDTRGAYFNKRLKRWESRVRGKTLGWFKTYQEAHRCSKNRKRDLFYQEYTQLCESTPKSWSNFSSENSDRSPTLC